jgi:hypothetical protein
MGDVIDLKPVSLVENHEFVADMARFSESLLTEKAIRKKYRMFDNTVWEKLADDDDLVRAIEAESVRRIRDGSSKREKAQALIVKGPAILDSIMSDPTANARHRIDSAKTLNDFASNGPGETTPASDRFLIQINLGSDTLTFNKSIRPLAPGEIDPNDSSPNDDSNRFGYPDPLPPDMIAAIAKKKTETDGGSNTL